MSDSEAKDQRVQDTSDTEGQNAPETAEHDLSEFVLISAGDKTPRWSPGERLHHLFGQRCDAVEQQGMTAHRAIDSEEGSLTYGELDHRANRLARHLVRLGLGAGDIIGLLFDPSIHSYISLIAVQKINAAYVRLDVSFSAEKIGFVSEGAVVETVRKIKYTDAAQRETARREALTPLSRTD